MNATTLLHACSVLFGDDVVITESFLAYLQFSGLKKAYRKKVLSTHPDRLSIPTHQDIANFHAVQRAFQLLSVYLQTRENNASANNDAPLESAPQTAGQMHCPQSLSQIRPFLLPPAYPHLSRPASSIDELYQGTLPKRQLLFGHFLYYCGLTSWRTITAVLVEQKRNRLRFGELSTLYGMLEADDVHRILTATTNPRTTFGATAVALGMLSEQQVQNLLEYQKIHQKKFGTILVDKALISSQELAILLALFRAHNRSHN